MATLATKVELYLKAKGKDSEAEFMSDRVRVTDNGSGPFIEAWDVVGVDKPTDEQLATYNTDATKSENNAVIRDTRKKAYGDLGDQLDEIYKDIDAWKTRIKKVKDDNPKG